MIKFAKVRDVNSPIRANNNDAGVDFFIPNDWNNGKPIHLGFGDSVLIPSGLKMDLSVNMMKVENKSGIAAKMGIIVGACIIDETYQGELFFNIIKPTHGIVEINPGMKIIQGVFYSVKYYNPVEVELDNLYSITSSRGEGGFGSTGI